MKILLTGGGTGGHFYPLIAVAEEVRSICLKEKILDPQIYFMAPEEYNPKELYDKEIQFVRVPAGKLRVGQTANSRILNFFDSIKTGFGILTAIVKMFFIMPHVVFSKGGYASFPAVMAARFFGIPIVMHESDSAPGRVNRITSKFATKIAVSYKEAAEYFPADKIAYTGQPVRREVAEPLRAGAEEYLKLEADTPVILIFCGSQGAQIINDAILNALPFLINKYQIIHQTGKRNFKEVTETAAVVLENNPHKDRYKTYDYLNALAIRMAAGTASLVISRGGSSIFEIALWGIPSIIIPITTSNGDHQRKNAYNYAREGGAVVIEESNLSPDIIVNEIERILTNPVIASRMRDNAKKFSRSDSAHLIASEVMKIALKHEPASEE